MAHPILKNIPLILTGLVAYALVQWLLFQGPDLLAEGAVIGLPTRDLYDHIWLHHWLTGVLRDGGSVFSTRLIAWPDGGALLHPDPTGLLLYAGLSTLLGPDASFNGMLLLQAWLGAASAWLLATRVSRSTLAGWLGGLLFGASPYVLGQVTGGETETVALWPLVLGLWGLERATERESLAAGLLAGSLGALAAVASWYYGAFWAIYAVFWALLRGPRRAVAGAFLGSVLLVAAPAIFYAHILSDAGNLFQGPDMPTYLREFPQMLAELVTDPAGLLGLFPAQTEAAGHLKSHYLGVIPLVLALIAFLRRRTDPGDRRRGPGPDAWFLGVAMAALILSLGPWLFVGGRSMELAGHPIPLPGRLLAELPLFRHMRIPYRWMGMVALALSVLGARGIVAMGRESARSLNLTVAIGTFYASALFVFELCLFTGLQPGARVLTTPPDISLAVPGHRAILDLPPRLFGDDARGRYLVWQRAHGRPIPYSLLMSGLSPSLAREPLVAWVAVMDSSDPLPSRPDDARQFGREDLASMVTTTLAGPVPQVEGAPARLRALGIDTVVLHSQLLEPGDARHIQVRLESILGPPTLSLSEGVAWYLADPRANGADR